MSLWICNRCDAIFGPCGVCPKCESNDVSRAEIEYENKPPNIRAYDLDKYYFAKSFDINKNKDKIINILSESYHANLVYQLEKLFQECSKSDYMNSGRIVLSKELTDKLDEYTRKKYEDLTEKEKAEIKTETNIMYAILKENGVFNNE